MSEDHPPRRSQWSYPGKDSCPSRRAPSGHLPPKHHLEAAIGTPQIGDWINQRFRLEERLGRGGMSAVYRAYDKVKQTQVALKFLSPALLGEPDAVTLFKREAQISMQLNHTHTLKVFDLQEHQGTYYLVMELLEGGTLRQWIQHADQTPDGVRYSEICRFLIEICDALVEAHKDTVHRDIKPENIGLTQSLKIKVMDFGLACLTSQHQTTLFREAVTQINAGTPYYMAPELLTGESSGSPLSDQFSVGVMAYELFTGHLPLGMTPSLASERADLPLELTDAIDRTLSLDPMKRFPSLATFQEILVRAQTQPPNSWNRVRRKFSQHRGLISSLSACLVLGLSALYPLHLRHQRTLNRQLQTERAWQELNETKQILDSLTTVVQEKRQALSFLEAQVAVQEKILETAPTHYPSEPFVSTDELEASRQLWNWLAPQVSSEDSFPVVEDVYYRAQASIIEGEFSRFEQQVQGLKKESEELVLSIDQAHSALQQFQVFSKLNRNLEALERSLPQSLEVKAAKTEQLIKSAQWSLAGGPLKELITACQGELQSAFEGAQESHQQALEAWEGLFGDLGPPDLSFIANPKQQANKALRHYHAGHSADAIQTLSQATTTLRDWTNEVSQFNQRLTASSPKPQSRIESMGIELIKVNNLYWSRWEIRVMDFARWIAEENKLSQESAAFWKNPGYPLGPTHPVVGISRRDAKEFSAWLGHKLTRYGRPTGRLPSRSEWQRLIISENLKLDRPFGIYADQVQWQSQHFREHYADLRIDPRPFLDPARIKPPSTSGLLGLTDGVWEWTGSFYTYQEQKAIADEAQRWLLAGGGTFGTVAFNAFPPPEPDLSFVLRKEGIGFRPVIVRNTLLR